VHSPLDPDRGRNTLRHGSYEIVRTAKIALDFERDM
jgi:hypothetical protein